MSSYEVGDEVEITDGTQAWEGVKGTVDQIEDVWIYVRITDSANHPDGKDLIGRSTGWTKLNLTLLQPSCENVVDDWS